MHVSVNFDVCASTGTCQQVCPEVFEVRSDGYLYVLDEHPGEALRDTVEEAADMCPTGAITVTDDPPPAAGDPAPAPASAPAPTADASAPTAPGSAP